MNVPIAALLLCEESTISALRVYVYSGNQVFLGMKAVVSGTVIFKFFTKSARVEVPCNSILQLSMLSTLLLLPLGSQY
jgi:hypothetical protein